MVYDGTDVVADIVDEDGDGIADRRRLYWILPKIDQRVGFVDIVGNTATAYYYITDQVGSVLQVLDSNGTAVNQYNYDAWGNLLKDGSFETVPNRYRFQGREWDERLQTYYFRYRMYFPETGTFSGPDMDIRLEAEGPGNYLFTANSPLRFTDPTGLYLLVPEAAKGAIEGIFGRENVSFKKQGKFWRVDLLPGAYAQFKANGYSKENPFHRQAMKLAAFNDEQGYTMGEVWARTAEIKKGIAASLNPHSGRQPVSPLAGIADGGTTTLTPRPSVNALPNGCVPCPEAEATGFAKLMDGTEVCFTRYDLTLEYAYRDSVRQAERATARATPYVLLAVAIMDMVPGDEAVAGMMGAEARGISRSALPRITEKGIARIEAHLSRPELAALGDPPNAAMVARLRAGNMSSADINFYMHELKESAIMKGGVGPRDAHLQTLEWQGIPYQPGYESQLYHESVIQLLREYFNPAAWPHQ